MMRKLRKRKRNGLIGLSAIAFAAAFACIISAEEDGKPIDEYLIIELEPVSMTEKENVPTKWSSDTDFVLFSLQDRMETDEYCITGIQVNEPILAPLLAQTADGWAYDTIALYDLVSYQQTADESDPSYDFRLQIPETAAITLYQRIDGTLQKSTLDAAYTEEQYNRLPLIQYSSETNHWLVLHLGAFKMTTPNQQTTQETQSNVPQTEPETPSTQVQSTTAPTTSVPTTAHVHTWVPVTNVIHHEATYKDVWVQDVAAWDETVVTKDAWDETVLVSEAYDEQVMVSEAYDEPIYDWVDICNECGHKFFDPSDDINEHMAAGCWSGWHAERMQVGTTHHDAVYQMVHHDAVYQTIHHAAETTVVHHEAIGHIEKTIDQAAWDETVITGFVCSECKETKEN